MIFPASSRRRSSYSPLPFPPVTPCRRGFTLIEMLATVAALVILLGLSVSLARHVRSRSAEELTRSLLSHLEKTMALYGDLPEVRMALAKVPRLKENISEADDETKLQANAMANSRAFVRALQGTDAIKFLRELPLSLFDDVMIRDAWGTPVVYMPPGAANTGGIAAQNRRFFQSAGPDRRFFDPRTGIEDNLYSYERPWEQ